MSVSGHNSLFVTPIYAPGTTGFAGRVQQSALTGKAIWSSGDGIVTNAPCGTLTSNDVFIGLI